MATTDSSTIRKALKTELGINSRQVSVRNDSYSMGSSVYVTIKDPSVDFKAVEEIANRQSRVRRCEGTGEILGGGNMFVKVSYSRKAEEIMATKHIEAVREAAQKLGESEDQGKMNYGFPIGDTGYTLFRGENGWGFAIFSGSCVGNFLNSIEDVALKIARLDRSEG